MDQKPGESSKMTSSIQHLFDTYLSSHSNRLHSEISALRQQLASQKVELICSNAGGEQSLPGILDGIVSRTEHLLTPERCIQRLLELLQQGSKGANTLDTCSSLLTEEQRVELDVLISQLKALKQQQSCRWMDIVRRLTTEFLPLEVYWRLHMEDILLLQTLFDHVLKDKKYCKKITKQLLQLCSTKKDLHICQQIFSVFCSHLVKIGFPEKKLEDATWRKASIEILDGITRGLLDCISLEAELLFPADLLCNNPDVSSVCFKKVCTHTISVLMSHHPNMKVSEALKRQMEWKSGKISDSLKTFYKQLLVPFDSSEVIGMLHRILEKQEVNWQTLLSFLATFLVCFPDAATVIQGYVAKLLTECLEMGDIEDTIVAFLLVRQSCMEGAHVFPAYSQWFQKTFRDGSDRPAGSKKAFTFLMKFLTDLVPFEPGDVLKAHIYHSPSIPAKCQDLWADYVLLVKTRLADLRVSLVEANTSIFGELESRSNQVMPGLQDVEKAVASFETTGKLPMTVMEASIFKKPYFVGKFLPALLHPRHLPDVPDSKMKFIEAMKATGKIPTSMLTKYEEACKKETQQLLEGVFEVEECDGVEEMLMEPHEQLNLRLKQLTDAVVSQTSKAKVSEIVSVISEKIEVMIGVPKESTVSMDLGCMIDVDQPPLLSTQIQIVDSVLNCVCHTLHGSGDPSQQSWLHQLVRMLSQHCSLHPTLFTRLFTLFSKNKGDNLLEPHVEGTAAFVFHVANNLALFPALHLKSQAAREKEEFLPFLLRCFPVNGGKEILLLHMFLTAYLKTAFHWLNTSPAECRELTWILPHQFIVLFAILTWRLHHKTQPIESHVLSKLQADIKEEEVKTAMAGGSNFWETTASVLFGSKRFQQLLKENQPTLEEWMDFELKVDPTMDFLGQLHRQSYQYAMISHLYRDQEAAVSVHDDTVKVDLTHCCSRMLRKLVTSLSRCWTAPGNCPRCHNCIQSDTCAVINQGAVSDFLFQLSKLTQNLPVCSSILPDGRRTETLWLREQTLALLTLSSCSTHIVVPEAILRIVLSCPAYLLFTNSASKEPSEESVRCTIRFIQEFLVSHIAHGGVLPLDVICHLLQGYVAVMPWCKDRAVMKPFEDHRMVILSALVHWHSICVLVPSLTDISSAWVMFHSAQIAFDRFFIDRSMSVSCMSSRDSFSIAACLHGTLVHRGWTSDAEIRKELIRCIHQSQPKVIEMLSYLLLITSDDLLLMACPLPKAEACMEWLAEIWQQFPHLICSAGNNHSYFTTLRYSLVPADRLPSIQLTIIRCLTRLSPETVVKEKGVLQVVVHLFACVCQHFENCKQQVADVDLILKLSQTVLTLLKVAPWDSLPTLNPDDVRQCGLDFYRIHQQRLQTRP